MRLLIALSCLLATPAAWAQVDILSPCTAGLRTLLYAGASADQLKAAYREVYACESASRCPFTGAELDYLASCDDYQLLEKLSRDLASRKGAPELGPELAVRAFGGCSPEQLETARSKGLFQRRFVDPDGDEGAKTAVCLGPNDLKWVPSPGSQPEPDVIEKKDSVSASQIRSTDHVTVSVTGGNGTLEDNRTPVVTRTYQLVNVDGKISARFPLVTTSDSLDEEWGPTKAFHGYRSFSGIVGDVGATGSVALSPSGHVTPGNDSAVERAALNALHLGYMFRRKAPNDIDMSFELVPIDLVVLEKDKILETSMKGSRIGILDFDLQAPFGSDNTQFILNGKTGLLVGEHQIQNRKVSAIPYLHADIGVGFKLGVVGDLQAIASVDLRTPPGADDDDRIAQRISFDRVLLLNDIARTALGINAGLKWTTQSSRSEYEGPDNGRRLNDFTGVVLELKPKFDLGAAETGL